MDTLTAVKGIMHYIQNVQEARVYHCTAPNLKGVPKLLRDEGQLIREYSGEELGVAYPLAKIVLFAPQIEKEFKPYVMVHEAFHIMDTVEVVAKRMQAYYSFFAPFMEHAVKSNEITQDQADASFDSVCVASSEFIADTAAYCLLEPTGYFKVFTKVEDIVTRRVNDSHNFLLEAFGARAEEEIKTLCEYVNMLVSIARNYTEDMSDEEYAGVFNFEELEAEVVIVDNKTRTCRNYQTTL